MSDKVEDIDGSFRWADIARSKQSEFITSEDVKSAFKFYEN